MTEYAWVISQNGTPTGVFTGEDAETESAFEMGYLTYHGDGYTLTKVPCEQRAGAYTRRDVS